MLIKDGARLIESVDDIVDTLGYPGNQLKDHAADAVQSATEKVETPLFDASQLNLNNSEKLIFDCLNNEPVHVENIIAEADLSPGNINASLISLQLKGLIKQLPGSFFIRR